MWRHCIRAHRDRVWPRSVQVERIALVLEVPRSKVGWSHLTQSHCCAASTRISPVDRGAMDALSRGHPSPASRCRSACDIADGVTRQVDIKIPRIKHHRS